MGLAAVLVLVGLLQGASPTSSPPSSPPCTSIPPQFPSPPPPSRPSPPAIALTVFSYPDAASARSCPTRVPVGRVPSSLTVTAGRRATLHCPHGQPGANVTWFRLGCPRPGCAPSRVGGAEVEGVETAADGTELVLSGAGRNQAGIFYCRVRAGTAEGASCGTFVRVRESAPSPFLALSEGTKNRLMAAEGGLLLLCAAGPGVLLLLRKRWANERLLQGKKSLGEEENLYEGLDVTQCSMYEDISHRPQPTYQDVGTHGATTAGLEKP